MYSLIFSIWLTDRATEKTLRNSVFTLQIVYKPLINNAVKIDNFFPNFLLYTCNIYKFVMLRYYTRNRLSYRTADNIRSVT